MENIKKKVENIKEKMESIKKKMESKIQKSMQYQTSEFGCIVLNELFCLLSLVKQAFRKKQSKQHPARPANSRSEKAGEKTFGSSTYNAAYGMTDWMMVCMYMHISQLSTTYMSY